MEIKASELFDILESIKIGVSSSVSAYKLLRCVHFQKDSISCYNGVVWAKALCSTNLECSVQYDLLYNIVKKLGNKVVSIVTNDSSLIIKTGKFKSSIPVVKDENISSMWPKVPKKVGEKVKINFDKIKFHKDLLDKVPTFTTNYPSVFIDGKNIFASDGLRLCVSTIKNKKTVIPKDVLDVLFVYQNAEVFETRSAFRVRVGIYEFIVSKASHEKKNFTDMLKQLKKRRKNCLVLKANKKFLKCLDRVEPALMYVIGNIVKMKLTGKKGKTIVEVIADSTSIVAKDSFSVTSKQSKDLTLVCNGMHLRHIVENTDYIEIFNMCKDIWVVAGYNKDVSIFLSAKEVK